MATALLEVVPTRYAKLKVRDVNPTLEEQIFRNMKNRICMDPTPGLGGNEGPN